MERIPIFISLFAALLHGGIGKLNWCTFRASETEALAIKPSFWPARQLASGWPRPLRARSHAFYMQGRNTNYVQRAWGKNIRNTKNKAMEKMQRIKRTYNASLKYLRSRRREQGRTGKTPYSACQGKVIKRMNNWNWKVGSIFTFLQAVRSGRNCNKCGRAANKMALKMLFYVKHFVNDAGVFSTGFEEGAVNYDGHFSRL